MTSDSIKTFFYTIVAVFGVLTLLAALAVIFILLTEQSVTVENIIIYMMFGWFGWSFPPLIGKIHREFSDINKTGKKPSKK